MSSKREQLKKLRQSRNVPPIKEMSSPAEDKLKELEHYESQMEEVKEAEENSRKDAVDIVKMQEETVVEQTTEKAAQEQQKEETEPEKEEKPQTSDVITTVPGAEPEAETEPEKEVNEEKKPQPETAEVSEESVQQPVQTAVKKKESTKRTSMALLVENNKFIRLRSMQLGMSIQEYVNLLIDEEIEREKSGQTAGMGDIEENLDMNYRRGQNSTIIALVLKESNARFLKRGGAMHGMNATAFLNHIISEEKKRESTEGPRQGVFDEF